MANNNVDLTNDRNILTLPPATLESDYDCQLKVPSISGEVNISIDGVTSTINGVKVLKVGTEWHFKGTPTNSTEPEGKTFMLLVREVADPTNFFTVEVCFIIKDKIALNEMLPPCMKDMAYTHTLIDAGSLAQYELRIKTEDNGNVPPGIGIEANQIKGQPSKDVPKDTVFEFIVELADKTTKALVASYPLRVKQFKKLALEGTIQKIIPVGYKYTSNLVINGGSGQYTINTAEINKILTEKMKDIVFSEEDRTFSGTLKAKIDSPNGIIVNLKITDKNYTDFFLPIPLDFTSKEISGITLTKPVKNTELEPIILGKEYQGHVTATGGYDALKYSIEPPVLGMNINVENGTITGVPQNIPINDKIKFIVHVKDSPPSGDPQKNEQFELIATVKHPVTAPLIEKAIDSNQNTTELFILKYFPRQGRDVSDFSFIEKGNKVNEINGRYGRITIKDKYIVVYTPSPDKKEGGVENIQYQVSNSTSQESGTIHFDVLPELTAVNKTASGKRRETVFINLSDDAIGGPFDSALTLPDYISGNSYCQVKNENNKIILQYTIPDKSEFVGNQIIIKYVLVRRVHTSELAKVTINITP